MRRDNPLQFFGLVVIGLGAMAIPFFIPHLNHLLAAVLFDAGSIVTIVSAVLFMIGRKTHKG